MIWHDEASIKEPSKGKRSHKIAVGVSAGMAARLDQVLLWQQTCRQCSRDYYRR